MPVPPPDPDRTPADFAVELRTSMTPVIGYLELLAAGEGGRDAEEQLRWIETIEWRLGSIGELSNEMLAFCSRVRDEVASGARGARP